MSSALPGISLNGTLDGMDVMTRMQALGKQRDEELARQALEASQQAQAAQAAYQQQAAAPPPQMEAMAAFLPTLIGNVASVIAQDPSFRQRAQQGLQAAKTEQFESRAQNLQALRDNALQMARRAESLGDLEAANKHRGQINTLEKQLEVIEKNKDRQLTINENKRDREAAERRARIAAGAAGVGGLGGGIGGVASLASQVARGEIEFSSVPGELKSAVSQFMTTNQMRVVPAKVRTTITELSAGRVALKRISELSNKINTASWQKRIGQGLKRTAGGVTQKDPDVAAFNAVRKGLLAALSRATGERGVLTNADVSRAKELIPSLFDSKDVAASKLKQFEDFFNEKESMARGAFYSEGGEAQTQQAPDNDPLGVR